ncbi:MAG TPA: AzlC family ABC transporter permease [Actinomycetota bacterium]|nr:AzlC family ABC transporter permease [Actinomycetota bacterium]
MSATTPRRSSALEGARAAFPVVLGYLGIGFAAGVVERSVGMTILEILLLACILYAGSAQFVTAGMLAAGSAAAAITVTVFFVNLRHLLLSAALSPHFRDEPPAKSFLLGAQLTDETFAVASAGLERAHDKGSWMLGLNLTAYTTWVVANVAGGVFGQALPDPEALGLDFALASMFAALLVLNLAGSASVRKGTGIALVAAVVAVGVKLLVPGNWNVMTATVVAASVGVAWTSR